MNKPPFLFEVAFPCLYRDLAIKIINALFGENTKIGERKV